MAGIAPSMSRSFVPTEFGESALPGTAKISRPWLMASFAKSSAPLFAGASTTTAATESPALIRLRARKKEPCCLAPGGYSLTTAPVRATSPASSALLPPASMGRKHAFVNGAFARQYKRISKNSVYDAVSRFNWIYGFTPFFMMSNTAAVVGQ